MRTLRSLRFLSLFLALALFAGPLPALAQTQSAPADSIAAAPSEVLGEARELIKGGDYDRAIDVLKSAIDKTRSDTDRLGEAYLLLAKTYVFLGTEYKFKPQGREQSNLNYQAARGVITEALKTPELRHLRPEPASEYPPEMLAMFGEVRSQMFGAFRIANLDPPGVAVTLDGDTLRSFPGDSLIGDVDIPIGQHLVVAREKGYEDLTEEITISPNATLERSYALKKKRSGMWYAGWGTAAAAVVAGTIALLSGGSSSATDQPLPGAPPPPTK